VKIKIYNWLEALEYRKQQARLRNTPSRCKFKGCRKGAPEGNYCFFHQQQSKMKTKQRRRRMMNDYYKMYETHETILKSTECDKRTRN